MEKEERLVAIRDIIIDTVTENYKNYGSFSGMSEEEIEKLVQDNIQGVSMMADLVSQRIDDKLF